MNPCYAFTPAPLPSIYEIRRENVRKIIAGRFGGSQTKFALAVSINQSSFVSRLLSTRPSCAKHIGQHLARHFEHRLGLPANWIDHNH